MFVNLVGCADLYTGLFEKFAMEFINNTILERLNCTTLDGLLYFAYYAQEHNKCGDFTLRHSIGSIS